MARSLWSDRPLGVKLSALVAAGAVALGVFAVVTVSALQESGERTEELLATTHATGLALEADMMHDAIRGDVLQALQGGSLHASAVTDLREHSATFLEVLDGVAADHLGADVDDAVAGVTPAVEEYLAAAGQIVTVAGRDPAAARSAYPSFAEAFGALEEELPTVQESVGAHASSAAEASAEQRETAIVTALVVAVGGVLVLAALGWTVTRSVVRPLHRVRGVLAGLADGDLRGSAGISSRDEIGQMAASLEASMANMRSVMTAIGDSSTTLASATEQLSASAADMARLADESSVQSGVVAGAAVQVSENVQTVAAGSEEMGASIREIAQNAGEVARVAGEAVAVADETTATVAKLGDSSLEIAGVVKVITGIAEQTNLLALNATIEAARAGEAGKGFAVVANEVKELAQETAKATEDISRRVATIQADTAGAVRAIGEISSIIARIDDAQSTIAAAVEEQTATTNEMNRNVAEAATSAGRIARNIDAVASATASTTRAMTDAQSAIDEVARMATSLNASIAAFRY
ncbi:methyl-accepting chemotaxis protein [Blastococcus sp. TBT05-19]|uniref:methyl-accepting chemotaxis protein n=1 Tax=Blastococcus sp. TBT05-19 TaxID=2250581 RepID=UPI000DE913FC|nr:methyl-accepting chemotaxis protein [Blastococcus sp. TBT05-19]RBY92344.1 methyl-accepting chemotaxis protein [Blastococcus sp. TBT05-19]